MAPLPSNAQESLDKAAASYTILRHAKSRTGRRPLHVDTLLKKEKDGTLYKGASPIPHLDLRRKMRAQREAEERHGWAEGMRMADEMMRQKHAAYGDTEPLWQGPNVGRVDYESKLPVKLNPRVVAPDRRSGDAPSSNVGGVGLREEDGRSNATTFSLGTTATGDIVPDALPSNYKLASPSLWYSLKFLAKKDYETAKKLISGEGKKRKEKKRGEDGGVKRAAVVDELNKLGAISDEEAMNTLQQLDALERNKLTPEQIGRYATIGAVAGPIIGVGRNLLQGRGIRGYFGDADTLLRRARHIAGDAVAGAATSGAIPIVRSALDRRAAIGKLHDYMQQDATPPHVQMPPPPGGTAPMIDPPVKTAGIGDLWHNIKGLNTAPAHSAAMEHATDLAGLGVMALGSGSHLMGQLAQRKDPNAPESGPISTPVQEGLDLGGLTAMAIPTIAALARLKSLKGTNPSHIAGGGHLGTNLLNIGGLGALMAPTVDKLQARIRSDPGEDPHAKQLLSEKAHRALELGGLGALTAGTWTNPSNDLWEKGLITAGYGALAAPHVSEAVGGPQIEGPTRTGLELGGLGALAIPSALAMMRKHGGVEKRALIERLVRLGATDVPGTPRLVMRQRGPEELGRLQQAVERAYDSRITNPLMGVVKRVTGKLPAGRVRNLVDKGALLVAEDPLGILATQLVPIPGAHPAYVAAKKGLEKAIDRVAPVPIPSMG